MTRQSRPKASRIPRSNQPTPLAELLEHAQSEAARLSGAALTPSAWHAAVGPRIAARTRVGRLTRGTLTVYTASAAWANELSFLAKDIVTRLARTGLGVHQVRFQIKDLGPPPPRRHAEQSRRSPRPLPRAPLPASLKQRLERVDDPELRAAIAEAAALSLAAYRRPTK